MAYTGELNTNELNSIFKALAERGKEGSLYREYSETHTNVFLKVLSSQLKKIDNSVILQAYGSAAEDLKCYERHDLGDMDIMIFPNSDNLIIHDELLEYSAENPLHVRIKGCDHPALRSCFVEDTGYVATSALKNFHPAIFGSEAPHIVNITTRVFETFLREEFSSILTGGLSNHSKSPAATLNLSRALAITSEQREILQDQASKFPFSLCAVDVEWITSMICSSKGIDYTRQHAELVKYIMSKIDPISHFQKLSVFPRENTDSDEKNGKRRTCIASQTRRETECYVTIEKKDEDREKVVLNYSFPSVPSKDGSYAVKATQSCANCDGNQSPTEDLQSTSSRLTAASPSLEVSTQLFPKPTGKVGTATEAMEKHSEEDVKKNGYRLDSDENESTIARLSSTQEKEVNSKAPPGGSDCPKKEDDQRELERKTRRKRWVNYLLGREAETKRTPILGKENYHQSLKQPSPKDQTGGEGLQGNSLGEGQNGDAINNRNGPNGGGQQMTKTGKESSKALAHNCNSHEDALQQESERRIQHRLIEHMFGTAKEAQTQQAKVKDTERVESGIDFIPALRSREWPQVAREWIKRERKWPSPDIVENIIHEGYHLVVKSPKKNGDPDCDFRISFSHAEYLLSQEMNDIQRDCYRCLKKYHRAYLCTQPKSLVSFHLKNLFLQTIEEAGAEMWTESNRAECMIKLFGNLLKVLKTKDLRHYFVKSYNLFGVDYVENPDVLEYLAGKVLEIMEDPKRFATQMIQSQAKPREKKMRISQENVPSEPIKCEQQMKSKEVSSNSIHDTKKSKTSAAIFPPTRLIQGRGLIQECEYHDLKDLHLDVTKELLYMAFDDADCRLEVVEPLERSLVQNLRELVRSEGFPVEEFPGVFETFWQRMGYPKVRLSTEPDMRRRMLVAIQSQIEMLKYILQQDDIEVENEEAVEAVHNRMLDPSAKKPFDLSHIIPSDIVIQFARSALAEFFVPKPAEPNLDDDIPLD